MSHPSTRHPLLLSAIILAAFAAPSRAAGSDSSRASHPAGSIEDLKSDIDRPEDFQRFIDGSRANKARLEDPAVAARPGEGGTAAPLGLSRPQNAPGLEAASVPSAAAPAAIARKTPLKKGFDFPPDLPVMKLSAMLGLGLMLIAGSMLEAPPAAEAEPLAEAPSRFIPNINIRTPEAASAPAGAESELAGQAFIDTRMPVPTWRAISWREQKLIDRWDSSREKALGRASLAQWLDASGGAEGVDVPLLKAKLRLEA